jgi:hypothetical protein
MSETEPHQASEASAEPTIDSLVHDGTLADPSLALAGLGAGLVLARLHSRITD